jgi:hypothetical protein
MAVGKIASSTGNYTTNGGALSKDSANGFNGQFTTNVANSLPQMFAPSLNLGVSVINTVAPAIAGYTSYTNGPGLGNGNIGYYNFTENNITIVTPDAVPTNPNNVIDGLSFQRYEISMTDWARGLGSSIVIGSDMFTPNNYVSGGFNTPTRQYISFGPYQTFIGKYNCRGIGANETFNGYTIEVAANTIVGGNNISTPLNAQGNYDSIYTADGANGYAPIKQFEYNTVLGNMNLSNSVTKQQGGYPNRMRFNTILGMGNASSDRYSRINGGQTQILTTDIISNSRCDSSKINNFNNNSIVGDRNLYLQGISEAGPVPFDGTYAEWPMQDCYGNVIMGSQILNNPIKNWFPAGIGDKNDYAERAFIGYNILIGNRIRTNKKVKSLLQSQIGGYGYTNKNTIISHGYGNSTNFTGGFENVIIGNAANFNQSSDEFEELSYSGLARNVILGDKALNQHGSFNAGSMITECVIIGNRAQQNGSQNQENIIVIGAFAESSSTTVNNEITLGNNSISALRCNVTSITSLSDARDKANIEPLSNASAFIKDLKPVKFDWNRRDGVKAKEHDIGFLAQDLDEAQSKHGIQEI